MKKKVRRIKLTSLLLTLAILLGCLPTYVFAVETGDSVPMADTTPSVMTPVEETTAAEIEETVLIEGPVVVEDEEIGAVAEVTSLRTADTKHFRLDDGTYTAVRYAAAVHRQDAEGTWQDIDNRLILTENANTKTYHTPDQRVTLASGYAPGAQLLTLSENGYTVSLGLMADTTPGNGHISTEEQPLDRWNSPTVEAGAARPTNYKYDTVDEAIRFDSSSSLTYHDIRANTDLEYELHGNTVKENIIVGARAEAYEYTFMLQTSGLTATAEEDGSISLKDATTGEAKYTIPAPYMYDAVGENSTAVAYDLMQVKDELYLLNVTADPTWINAEDRAFPVTIDPTIVMTYENVLADAYTISYSPGSNYGSDTKLYVYSSYTTYIKMELPELPAGASFNDAYLDISYYYALTSGSSEVEIYPIYTEWDESTITHEMANGLAGEFPGFSMGPCLATQTLPASSSITVDNPGLARFYVDEAASDWYDGEANNGIAIKWKSGNNPVMFYSREAQFEDSIYFVVSYTPGVADGVYALRNKSSSTRWMTVESDSPWAGKHIQQAYSATSPAETTVFDRSSLFKISRVGYTDRFIIRSMLNNNLSFGVSGTEIITKTIPSDDADVAAADTFYISWNGTGFIISPYSNRNIVIHMGSTSTANLTTISKMSHTAASRWEFVEYQGIHRGGLHAFGPSTWGSNGIVVGSTGEATFFSYSTHINANTLQMEAVRPFSYRDDVADTTWNSGTSKLTLVANNPGTVRLQGTIYTSGTNSAKHTLHFDYMIIPEAGLYSFMNAGTGRYMDIDGPSTTAGAIIHQWQFHVGSSQKWNVEHVPGANGYIRIKSAYSNYYLGVDPNNTSLIKQYGTQSDYTLWKIEQNFTMAAQLICKATESNNLTLAIPSMSDVNGTDLTQVTYTKDDNDQDEWFMYKCNYTLNVNHYYDQGFVERFASDDSSAHQIIDSCQNVVAEKFMQIFGLQICPTYSKYTSPADECKMAQFGLVSFDNTVDPCPHDSDHLNTTALRDSRNDGTTNTATVIWTGHVLTNNESSDASLTRYSAVITPQGAIYDEDYTPKSDFAIVMFHETALMHELSHLLGTSDHYCYNVSNSTSDEPCDNPNCDICVFGESEERDCLMTNDLYSIANHSGIWLYCEECEGVIKEHLSDHH